MSAPGQVHGGAFTTMFRGNWSEVDTIVVGLLVLMGSSAFLLPLLEQQHYGITRSGQSQQDHQVDGDARVELSGVPIVMGSQTRADNNEAGDQAVNCDDTCQRNKRDLSAQESMANAAWAMFWVAFFGFWVGAGTLFLVWRTVEHTKEAVGHARDAALAANNTNQIAIADRRPWVTVRREVECDFSVADIQPGAKASELFRYQAHLAWWHSVENLGKSPAFGVKIAQKLIVADGFVNAHRQLRDFVDEINTEWETRTELTVFPGETLGRSSNWMSTLIKHEDARGDEFFLLVAIAYRTQQSDIYGMEGRVCLISSERGVQGPKISKLIEYAEARITR